MLLPRAPFLGATEHCREWPGPFRTGPSTTVLGGWGGAMSPSFSFQGVSTAVLSASCAHASREELGLWRPRDGEEEKAGSETAWLRGPERSVPSGAHPQEPSSCSQGMSSKHPTAPQHRWLATCSTARSPSRWRRSSPHPWCSAPARRCWPTPGACCAP